MKTRMHRFWLSISLAAASLASPLSPKLWSHDLPTRRSPDAVSNYDSDCGWNYLMDDCLDSQESAGAACFGNSASGNYPVDSAAVANGLDFDVALSRNSLAKFTSEMACWVSRWERLQAKAGEAARADLLAHTLVAQKLAAARPDFGCPPAPAINQLDTCAFEAEYQAMKSAAELLGAETTTAGESTVNKAGLARSLAAAADIEAAAIDSIPAAADEPIRCGGETSEITSVNRQSDGFDAAAVDEYMSYDVDPRDAHWIGGLGKSWKLKSGLYAPLPEDTDSVSEITDSEGAIAAGQPAEAELTDEDFAWTDDAMDSHVAPELADSLKDRVAEALEWLDNTSCIVAAEFCGMDYTRQLGERWGQLALASAQHSMTSFVGIGQYLELPPAVADPTLDVLVVFTDSDGMEMIVPSSLARAWNRPERDDTMEATPAATLDPYDAAAEEFATDQIASNNSIDSFSVAVALPKINFLQLRREILSMAAARLDSLGTACLETADQLSNWAETQIASRDEIDIR